MGVFGKWGKREKKQQSKQSTLGGNRSLDARKIDQVEKGPSRVKIQRGIIRKVNQTPGGGRGSKNGKDFAVRWGQKGK